MTQAGRGSGNGTIKARPISRFGLAIITRKRAAKTLFHIFANGQQVCTFETNSALYNGSSTDTNHVAYYYHEDNINSSCALSSGATPTSQQEVNVYYPFGRTGPRQSAGKLSGLAPFYRTDFGC